MKNRNRMIFNFAKEYLLSFNGITNEIINQHLECWKKRDVHDLSGLFRAMISNAKNRQGMPNAIGDVDILSKILFGFDSIKVVQKYQSWELLFDKINDEIHPPGRMIKNNPHNYWVIYCKSILSIANYINRFSSFLAFKEYVSQFVNSSSPDIRIALPLLLKEEIFGYRFALACDFLKENVDPHFVKPDTHIKEIFIGINICEKGANDYQIFRKVIDYADSIQELPFAVDKLFWLIGSGNFHESNIKIQTSKKEFIQNVLKSIN